MNNKQLTITAPWKRAVYNRSNFPENSKGLFYSHIIRQTLNGEYDYLFTPDEIFYVGQYPTAYIKTIDVLPTADDEKKWRLFLWNQSIVSILIVVVKNKEIRVYTSQESRNQTPIKIFQTTAEALDCLQTQIESGTFFKNNIDRFERKKTVDYQLLEELKKTARKLAKEITKKNGEHKEENNSLQISQKFLTRIIFLCYLIDRGMIKGEHFQDKNKELAKLTSSSSKSPYRLYHALRDTSFNKRYLVINQLFLHVKNEFNGSLFELGDTKESFDESDNEFFQILVNFLSGSITDQQVFDFMACDFNIIPVETISAIYESFLADQGNQREKGAYYTPPHLTELVVDIALENHLQSEKKLYELQVLDPACGSGVFLVSLFGRMVEQLRRDTSYQIEQPNINWGKSIFDLLKNFHGIDLNSVASHITCFSLYLAALEQLKPTDLDQLKKKQILLPPLLFDPQNGHNRGKNIFTVNFFDEKLPLEQKQFDLIVGNPPWVSRGYQKDAVFLDWRQKHKKTKPAPEKQIAYGFLWNSLSHITPDGTICLLVPASVLWANQTDVFLKKWLQQVTVERVINFSDLSFLLFPKASHPCVTIRFKNGYNDDGHQDNIILYETPKIDQRNQLGGPIYIREEDQIYIFQKNAIAAANKDASRMVWKVPFWGKGRDKQLLEHLNTLPKLCQLTSTPKTQKPITTPFIHGRGCQFYDVTNTPKQQKRHDPWWNKGIPFLNTKNDFDLLITRNDTTDKISQTFQGLITSPDRRLFKFPKIVINQGFTKVAFCSDPILFRHSLLSIAVIKKEKEDILRFLSIVLRSKLIQYYLFHTSANWGSERDKVHVDELLSIPFFLPEDAPNPTVALKCFEEVLKRFKEYEKKALKASTVNLTSFDFMKEAKKVREECEPFVRKYYGINKFDDHLIEDTIEIIIPSTTPASRDKPIPTLKMVTDTQCRKYVNEFLDTIKAFCWNEKGYPYSAHLYLPGRASDYGIVRVDRSYKQTKSVTESKDDVELYKVIRRISKHLKQFESERLIHCLNLKVFIDESLFILKPIQYRFWTRIAAQNDAEEIITSMVLQKGGAK
jgi:type I restriction-modification system DNA methylase subunit